MKGPKYYHGTQPTARLVDLSRKLRQSQTDAEQLLWARVRSRQVARAKFRRQHEYGPYILDFFWLEGRLAIELDGGQHLSDEGLAKDAERTAYLSGHGVIVLRFSNLDVLGDVESVLLAIWNQVVALTPALSQRERERESGANAEEANAEEANAEEANAEEANAEEANAEEANAECRMRMQNEECRMRNGRLLFPLPLGEG
ncbi:MAG: endonuclease domain-containing protein [Chloroflexota bacterium]